MDEVNVNIGGRTISAQRIDTDWALSLMCNGVIVKVKINRWRGNSKLKEDDLGITYLNNDTQQYNKKYIKLGTQKLIPPDMEKIFHSFELSAHVNNSNFGFDTVWGRFIPYTAFGEWKDKNDSLKKEYLELAKDFLANYDDLVIQVKRDYKEIAKDVWARLYPQSKNNPIDSFLEEFANNAISKIPPIEKLAGSFKYDTTYFDIPIPSIIQDDLLKASNIKRENELNDVQQALAIESKQRIAEECISRKKELIDSFMESTVVKIRSCIGDLCDDILKSLEKSNYVISISHFNKINKMTRKFKLMNFYNDEEIDNMIKDLEVEVSKFKGERDDGLVADKIRKISKLGKKEFVPIRFVNMVDNMII